MRLVICDGNRILSEALAIALAARDHELNAVAVTTAEECVSAVGSYWPEVCLLDVHLPEIADGLHVIREIRSQFPETAVVAVGDGSDPSTLAKARQEGIRGFLARSRSVSEVAEALWRIASGEQVFDSVPRTAWRPAPPFELTPREAEVLRRIAVGQHTRQMACEMNVSISTLRSHVRNVFAKMGVHSRLEAAAAARDAHLVEEMPTPRLPSKDQQSIPSSVQPGDEERGLPLTPQLSAFSLLQVGVSRVADSG